VFFRFLLLRTFFANGHNVREPAAGTKETGKGSGCKGVILLEKLFSVWNKFW